MTDGTAPEPAAGRAPRASKRTIARTALRAVGAIAGQVAIYYMLPLDRVPGWLGISILVVGLVLLTGLVGMQARSIVASPFPALRAIEALATSIPLFLLLFAGSYVVLDAMSASNFSELLSRTDALYFTVTVFATVGFGDITATSQAARLVVTGQMVADLVIIGVVIRVLASAVERGRKHQAAASKREN